MTKTKKVVALLKDMMINAKYEKWFNDKCSEILTDEEFNRMQTFADIQYSDADKILNEIERYGEPYELSERTPMHRFALKISVVEDTTYVVSDMEPNKDLVEGICYLMARLNEYNSIHASVEYDENYETIQLNINANFKQSEMQRMIQEFWA